MAIYDIEMNYLNSGGSYDILCPRIGLFDFYSTSYIGVGQEQLDLTLRSKYDFMETPLIFFIFQNNSLLVASENNNTNDDGSNKAVYYNIETDRKQTIVYHFYPDSLRLYLEEQDLPGAIIKRVVFNVNGLQGYFFSILFT